MTAHSFRALVALALGLVFTSQSIADPIDVGDPAEGPDYKVPFGVQMRAGNRVFDLPVEELQGTDKQTFEWIYEDDVSGDGFRAVVAGILDPDPSIAWGISVTDFGAP